MVKSIHIENSYKIWSIKTMNEMIYMEFRRKYNEIDVEYYMNRTYNSMYIEWYLHNIGYWFTLLFVKCEKIKALNERFKHVDLEGVNNA